MNRALGLSLDGVPTVDVYFVQRHADVANQNALHFGHLVQVLCAPQEYVQVFGVVGEVKGVRFVHVDGHGVEGEDVLALKFYLT